MLRMPALVPRGRNQLDGLFFQSLIQPATIIVGNDGYQPLGAESNDGHHFFFFGGWRAHHGQGFLFESCRQSSQSAEMS
jgi:hypothetical protein